MVKRFAFTMTVRAERLAEFGEVRREGLDGLRAPEMIEQAHDSAEGR